jgi:multidrug efflux pump
MEETKDGYAGWVRWSILRSGRLMMIYAAILGAVAFAFIRLPGGFLPVDDQGFITTDVLTPPEASFPRTLDVVKRVENYLIKREGIDTVTFLTGFSFLGQGQNTAQAFITLKDWSQRRRIDDAESIVADVNRTFAPLRDGRVTALQPPPIDNLGNSSGFSFRLQDRGQRGYAELMKAKDQLLAATKQSSVLEEVYVEGLSPAAEVELVIDRDKSAALGVTFEEINNVISTNLGSSYVNDFPNRGRMQRVIVQADRDARMQPDHILSYNVRNSSGQLVPMSSFATVRWSVGPSQIVGFNYYPSVRFSGSAKPGYTSGQAIREMERLAARLPRGFGYEWAGQSLQEKLSGSQAPLLLMLSVLLAFLVLAALYESWTIPLSVLLTVPLGVMGAVTAAMLRGLPNDVYFTVGIVTIIGLAAKDGILIIEFAKALREQGRSIGDATIEACRMRFRPIVMTGLAFVFGVAPMTIAAGASAKSQHALGTVVMGGMIAVVILALLMVPIFFVAVRAFFSRQVRNELRSAAGNSPGTEA